MLNNFDPYYDTRIKEHTVEVCRNHAREGDGSYRLAEGDGRDAYLVAEVDYVYHQTTQTSVRPSVETPHKYDEINVDGMLTLFDAARDSDIERVVLDSPSSVYGKPEYLTYDESYPTTPVSSYDASKLAADLES